MSESVPGNSAMHQNKGRARIKNPRVRKDTGFSLFGSLGRARTADLVINSPRNTLKQRANIFY